MLRIEPLPAFVIGVVLAVVLAVVGAVTALSGPTVWTSKTVMFINDPLALATAGDQGQLLKLDVLRLKYAGLVGTDSIAVPVAHELQLPVGEVLGAVTTQVPSESLIMVVVATWPTPAGATRLSQTVASEITKYVDAEDIAYAIPVTNRFTFTVVNPASRATPSGPSAYYAATLAAGLGAAGLIVGFGTTQLVRRRARVT